MIKINLEEIEATYSAMSDEEFSRLRPGDLTPEANVLYARELSRRSPAIAEELRERNQDEAREAARLALLEPESDPMPEPGVRAWLSLAVLGAGFILAFALPLDGSRIGRPGFLAILAVTTSTRWIRYSIQKSAWNERRRQREIETPVAGGEGVEDVG